MVTAPDYSSGNLSADNASCVLFDTHLVEFLEILWLWVWLSEMLMCLFVIPFVADDCR
jgi:hypothetical protein